MSRATIETTAQRVRVRSCACILVATWCALGCTQPERPPHGVVAANSRERANEASLFAPTTPERKIPQDAAHSHSDGATSNATALPPDASLASGSATAQTKEKKSCRVLAIGDSLTDPQSQGGGYLKVLEQKCGCTVDNRSKGGAMVNQMRKALETHLRDNSTHYDYIVVFGGVNDLYSDKTAHRTVMKIENDLSAIYRMGHDRGARIIAITVAPWGGFARYFTLERQANTLALNRWIVAKTALAPNDITVDAYGALSCDNPEVLCERFSRPYKDGIHFGPKGHDRLGQALLDALGPDACTN